MEKLEFRSEAEKEIFMQLISKKEAIRLCFEQKDSSYMESEVQKLDDMLDELEQHYSLAIYDLQDPSRMKRLFGRVFGKIFKVFFMGPFAKKQIAYNRQVLNTLHNLQETQEGILEAMAKMNGFEYDTLDYQIHRLEMYADKTAKKGEVHLLYSETPCSLVPLSEFGKQEMA